ncbi:MAG: hypothetical protein DRJ50_13460, partial [Actinobacteria bacterium]
MLIEVTSVIAPAFLLPDWIIAALTTLLVLGAFPVLLLSWRYEITREGIKRDTRSVPDEMKRSARSVSALIAVVLLVITTALWVNYFRTQTSNELETILKAQQGAPEIGEDGSIHSIAVLPFEDFSPDGGRRLLADGIAEAILHLLAQNKDLLVTARTSSFYFRDKDVTVAEIGRILGVQALLEGSIQIVKDQLRVTSQLVRASDQSQIWSNVYEAPLDDLFKVQDAIAYEVRDLVLPQGNPTAGSQGQFHPPSVEAFQLLLEARALIDDPESTQKAIRLIRLIIELWPDYADAHAWLAMAYQEKWINLSASHTASISESREASDQSLRAADATLALDPNNHLALLIKGWASAGSTSEGYHEAIARVAASGPNDPAVLGWLADLMSYSAAYKEARTFRERARAVDPGDYDVLLNYLYSTCGSEPQIPIVESHLQDYPVSQRDALYMRSIALFCDEQFIEWITTAIKLARLDSSPDSAFNALMMLAALGHEEALALVGGAHRLMPGRFKRPALYDAFSPLYFTEILDERLETYRAHMRSNLVSGGLTIMYTRTLIMAGDYEAAAGNLDREKAGWDAFYAPEGGRFWTGRTITIYAYHTWLLARRGETAQAQALAEELLQALKNNQVEKWSGSGGRLQDIPLLVLLLNARQEQAVEWLLEAEQDQWLFFQPVLTSPIYAEFREIPEVAESLERMTTWRAGLLDQLVATGLPEVQDPSLLLSYMDSLVTPTHNEQAQIALHFDTDPAAALRYYERALEQDPDNVAIIDQVAGLALGYGLVDEAIVLRERAISLAPTDPFAHHDLSVAYACAQRWDDAVSSIRTSLELEPEISYTQRWMGMMLILNDEPQVAMDVIQQIPEGHHRSIGLVLAHYALGQQAESDAALSEWKEKGAAAVPFRVAWAYAYRGEADLAFEWLYKAGTTGRQVPLAAVHPFLVKLHDDPRWLPYLES